MNDKGVFKLGSDSSVELTGDASIMIGSDASIRLGTNKFNGLKTPATKTINFDTNIYEISYIDTENGIIHITKKEQSK